MIEFTLSVYDAQKSMICNDYVSYEVRTCAYSRTRLHISYTGFRNFDLTDSVINYN